MSKSVIEITKSLCSGCSACQNVCMHNAISIDLNEEGFYCATVNIEACVNCGVCQRVCPQLTVNNGKSICEALAFAAQSNSEQMVRQSSSGAVAAELSRWAISQGYGVVGVYYDCNDNLARFSVAESEEEISRFKGSKYLQGNPARVYQAVINTVKADNCRKYLVFGTPCQIYGLGNLLEFNKIRDNFILVDFFCHGVPSNILWQQYLKSIHVNQETIQRVTFRSKKIGWHNFVITVKSADREYEKTSESDLFYKAFFDNVFFSKSCYDCQPRMNKSKADMRLGDFWGKKYQDREDGISAVLTFTHRGKKLLDEIDAIRIIEETSPDDICCAQSVHPYGEIKIRQYAIDLLRDTSDLKNTIKTYRKRFPIKRRIKLRLKELTGCMPSAMRATIRRVYRKAF